MMSNGAIIAIIFGGLYGLLLVIAGVGGLTTWLQNRWHKDGSKERGPEPGTIRIVEKMDKAGELYYVAERWGWCLMDRGFDWHEFTVGCDTPEEAQEKANARIDNQREEAERQAERDNRATHHKVMGEFKP